MSQTQDSNALKWSFALACIPTTIVVVLISPLLFGEASGEAWLAGYTMAMLVAGNGGIAVLVCSLIGVIVAIVGWRRTHSHWAWAALALNILVPFAIPAAFALDRHLEMAADKSWPVYAMHKAVSEGDLKPVKKLIKKHDASVNQMLDGYAPLHRAVASGDINMVEYLLESDANSNASCFGSEAPLHMLAASKWCSCEVEPCTCVRILDALIKHGADINRECGVYRTDFTSPIAPGKPGSWTPLLIAVDTNNVTQIKHLVKRGANLNLESNGKTGLNIAARLGQTDTVKFLIDNGADVNFGGWLKYSPLMAAAATGNRSMIELLLSAGADVTTTDQSGGTLLHRVFVCMDGKKISEIIELLLALGLAVDSRDSYGQTPLHRAASEYRPGTIELLLSRGADVNARTKTGLTPLHRAVGSYMTTNVRVLLDSGADSNAADLQGITPLHKALSRCATGKLSEYQKDIAEMLLQHGAGIDIKAPTKAGTTLIDLVKAWQVKNDQERRHQQEIIALLEKYSKTGQVNQ